MRYLALVQRKRFLGHQELHLLARELSEYSWSPTHGQLGSELANRFNPSALVIVELNANQQPVNIEEASGYLVALLQSFSRFSESFKAQVQEIESWKQSLIYQSQELSRRESELLERAQDLEVHFTQIAGTESQGDALEPALYPDILATQQEQLIRVRDTFQSLLPDTNDLAFEHDWATWQIDWQGYTEDAAQLALLEKELAYAQQDYEQHCHSLQYRLATWQANSTNWEREQHLLNCLSEGNTANPDAKTLPPQIEQRQLREQQHEYQQRANLVLEQENELHSQQAQLQLLHSQLTQDLSTAERRELEEEREFVEQSCQILRESLTQQRQRLSVEQHKVEQQVGQLETLIERLEDSTRVTERTSRDLETRLQPHQSSLAERRARLEQEQVELNITQSQLNQRKETLSEAQAACARHRQTNQLQCTHLQVCQLELEKRRGALEARRLVAQECAPGLARLDLLIGQHL